MATAAYLAFEPADEDAARAGRAPNSSAMAGRVIALGAELRVQDSIAALVQAVGEARRRRRARLARRRRRAHGCSAKSRPRSTTAAPIIVGADRRSRRRVAGSTPRSISTPASICAHGARSEALAQDRRSARAPRAGAGASSPCSTSRAASARPCWRQICSRRRTWPTSARSASSTSIRSTISRSISCRPASATASATATTPSIRHARSRAATPARRATDFARHRRAAQPRQARQAAELRTGRRR